MSDSRDISRDSDNQSNVVGFIPRGHLSAAFHTASPQAQLDEMDWQLSRAVFEQRIADIRRLLKRGANPNRPFKTEGAEGVEIPLLALAARHTNYRVFSTLLGYNKTNPFVSDSSGQGVQAYIESGISGARKRTALIKKMQSMVPPPENENRPGINIYGPALPVRFMIQGQKPN